MNSFTLRTHVINNIQTLHLHETLKKLNQFFSSYHAAKKLTSKNTKILSTKYFKKYTEKNIMGARPYKVQAQDKVTAAIRSAAAPE